MSKRRKREIKRDAESISVAIPFDPDCPQAAEGTQVLSASITPKTAARPIRVIFRSAP